MNVTLSEMTVKTDILVAASPAKALGCYTLTEPKLFSFTFFLFFSTVDGKQFTNRLVSSDMQEKRAQLPYIKATYVGISNFLTKCQEICQYFFDSMLR